MVRFSGTVISLVVAAAAYAPAWAQDSTPPEDQEERSIYHRYCGNALMMPWKTIAGDGDYFHIATNPSDAGGTRANFRICNASTTDPVIVRLDNQSDKSAVIGTQSCVDVFNAVHISVHAKELPGKDQKKDNTVHGYYCRIP